jgi:hypothetical protein
MLVMGVAPPGRLYVGAVVAKLAKRAVVTIAARRDNASLAMSVALPEN